MLAYHCDSNVILVEPFQSCLDCQRIAAHGRIMAHLRDQGQLVEHQILDKEASKYYSHAIMQEWKATYQLVPPNVHRASAAEQAIGTFKARFLSILAGINPALPYYLWDKLLPQTELTLNLLRQSTLASAISAWESFNGPLNYDATPLGPISCPVIIHNKASTQKSWDFRGRDGFSIGTALHHYRCFQVVDSATNCVVISDTVKFSHSYLKQPAITYDDRLPHAINYLSSAIADAPASSLDLQLQAITALRNLIAKWVTMPTASPLAPPPLQRPAPPAQAPAEPQSPRVPLNPMPIAQRTRSQRCLPTPNATDAVAHRMRSKLAVLLATLAASSQRVSAFTPTNLATSVLDHDTGLSLDYKQLRTHPKLGPIWSKSYVNELGGLCQGIGTDDSCTNQHVQGTNTFYVIDYDDIPFDRRSEITYSKVVCKVHPEKSDPDRTRITIGGNRICYPGDEFIDEYDLTHHVRDGWVYFQIVKGVYGLPQSGILANKLLETRLNAAGYNQLDATPGHWRHKWQPVMFTLIVNDFGVEYVGLSHAHHLRDILQTHYKIT
eukprot:CCRYP_001010-RA/>CCRYP_001010-RA protein AED:0.32 eAED:0.24 QI:0/0/0/1/0.5/0.66/3/0/551